MMAASTKLDELAAYNLYTDARVRFRDCDPMGHVNNAVYLTYLEMARTAYWRDVVAVPDFRRVGFILAAAHIDYLEPATVDEQLRIYIRAGDIRRSSFDFHYVIWNIDRDVAAARAMTVQVMYDYTARKPTPVPPELRRVITSFESR